MADPTYNPNAVRAWLDGEVFIAPAGTAMPTDLDTPLPSAWRSLGVLSQDDGADENRSETSTDIHGWGKGRIRTLHNQFVLDWTVVALERNPAIEELINPQHGATTSQGLTTWETKAPVHTPVAVVLQIADGPKRERRCAYRADATVSATKKASETDVEKTTITLNLYANDTGSFFRTISNDPIMAGLVSS